MRGLSTKAVAIVGGGNGIGAAAAHRLAAEGARVMIGDIVEENARAVASEINAAGGEASAARIDVVSPESCEQFIEGSQAQWGRLDGVYTAAADTSKQTLGRDSNLLEVPLEVWQRTLDVNLTGTFHVCRAAIPALLENGGGSLTVTLSGLAFYGDLKRPAYGASKAGLTSLIRHIVENWGAQGIRCNGVAPGLVMSEAAGRNMPVSERDAILAKQRSHRLGQPEDVAGMVAMLQSDDGAFINGQVYLVNGGRA